MNKKISFPIAIIIIVVFAVFVGGVAAWQYLKIPVETEPPQIKIPPDQTAEWKVYRNEKIGIEFKYPPDWAVPEIEERESRYDCQYKEIKFSVSGKIYTYLAIVAIKDKSYFICFESNFDFREKKLIEFLQEINKDVELSKNSKEKIKENLNLYYEDSIGGDYPVFYADLIYNSKLNSWGIKLIAYHGSDYDAINYRYQTIFIKNNKLIFTEIDLFFYDKNLNWANEEMIRYFEEGKSFEKMILDSLEDEESQIYKTVEKYDTISKSISLDF